MNVREVYCNSCERTISNYVERRFRFCFQSLLLSVILLLLLLLSRYDEVIKTTLQVILHINLTELVWSQVTLPVSNGGLGV